MIRKYEVLQKIEDTGVVGIIRVDDVEYGTMAAEAIFDGGIPVIEVSMTHRGAIEIMAQMTARLNARGLLLGAGTVADSETARACILAGSEFIFAHCFSEDVARVCNRYGVPYIPGVGTVTEIMRAFECGVDVVKVFPGEVLGPQFVRAVRGPLPNARMLAVGGVSSGNLESWFRAGVVGVGLGSALTKPDGRTGTRETIGAASRDIVAKIAAIRSEKGA
ncbi:MAG: bifunctional 2-keto-4-hydroxyglutarate aldolase/2-keto-3-deoxy-6-phosphogluconate aldolase [Synergistaceae bacterium]|jgi:2-dehydro-3-deoxyphosphogluconate aldolase/(4S)-4-hydroxy-2-oxoglutarate aldolase|nr:bifunctional 2-keto-4-hydroxyglutarate aldolase/2-keto-3-deoxy-6-phosphogluconate aldolase [Synergistaceae bacterium]